MAVIISPIFRKGNWGSGCMPHQKHTTIQRQSLVPNSAFSIFGPVPLLPCHAAFLPVLLPVQYILLWGKGHLRKSACLSLAPSSFWYSCLSFLEPCECMGASPLHAACCEFLFPQQVHMVAFAIVCGPVADCWVSLPSCVSWSQHD
jgi:hypothetical protein